MAEPLLDREQLIQLIQGVLLQRLLESSTQRPDLITPGSTGSLENARPATFLGRVTLGGESPEEILSRLPVDVPDGEGLGVAGELLRNLPVAAALGPIRTAQQRQILRALNRAAPDLLEQLRQLPQRIDIEAGIPPSERNIPGAFVVDPQGSSGRLFVNPEVLRGRVPDVGRIPQRDPRSSVGNLPRIAAHEAQPAATEFELIPQVSNRSARREARQILDVLMKAGVPDTDRPIQLYKLLLHNTRSKNVEALSEGLSFLREAEVGKGVSPAIRESITNRLLKEIETKRGR